jgi:hypothetical protein
MAGEQLEELANVSGCTVYGGVECQWYLCRINFWIQCTILWPYIYIKFSLYTKRPVSLNNYVL